MLHATAMQNITAFSDLLPKGGSSVHLTSKPEVTAIAMNHNITSSRIQVIFESADVQTEKQAVSCFCPLWAAPLARITPRATEK